TPFIIAKSAKKYETNILANEKLVFSNTTSLDDMISLDRDQVISLSENNSDNEFSINTYWLAKNLVATSKITDYTSLTEYHVKYTEEIHTSLEIYTLDYPLFELLEESCADYGSYSNKPDAIVNELSIFIQAKNLPIDRLMNIGSDGASVML
ncbi:9136_t:CDS:2, partial [Racocetra fulgida]